MSPEDDNTVLKALGMIITNEILGFQKVFTTATSLFGA
jgi:hypothetical protein